MVKYLNIGTGGLVDLYAIERVGEVGGDSSYLRYKVHMKSGHSFEVLDREFPRSNLVSAMMELK
jgi:hypothetical protein